MVELPNGKMKSREGTVVDADDLMALMVEDAYKTSMELGKFDDMTEEERREIARIVGMGALKYFILKVDARKNMLFNPEESIDFNGNTGPFIQYTYARIRSILRKAENTQTAPNSSLFTLHSSLFILPQCLHHEGRLLRTLGRALWGDAASSEQPLVCVRTGGVRLSWPWVYHRTDNLDEQARTEGEPRWPDAG
jgi:arginyl-tRNA synthetase